MAMSSLWWTAILLLALTVSMCSGVPTYKDFVRKHVDPKRPSSNDRNYCNVMMKRRGMASNGSCKTLNTFVHTAPQNLIPVCRNQPDRALRTTRKRFPVTVCRLISSKPKCTYRGKRYNHRVQVGCSGGRPVHLQKTF